MIKFHYAEDAIDFILSLVQAADDMYVTLINEIGQTNVSKNYYQLITSI
jgi:hypothetical protein